MSASVKRLSCMESEPMVSYFPADTVEQAVSILLESMNEDDRRALAAIPEDEVVVQCHFGLSMWVRNHFMLFADGNPLVADCVRFAGDCHTSAYGGELHPDDASAIIVQEAWKVLNGGEAPDNDVS